VTIPHGPAARDAAEDETRGTELARRLGAMLKCAEVEDPFEYRFMFDVTANTFLQKLVPKRLMDRKLDLTPGERFRSLLVLCYATKVIDPGEKLLDNVAVLMRELVRVSPKSTMRLGMIVTEIALHASEQGTLSKESDCRERFARLDGRKCACDAAALDPYHEACGFMLADQLGMKEGAARVTSKGEYIAAVFADAFLPHLGESADGVAGRLLEGEYWEASVEALRACAKTATLEDLGKYFQ